MLGITAPAEGAAVAPEQREKILRMQGDLIWLVREGYVTEFIDGGLYAPPAMVEARKKEVEAEEHDPENFPEAPPPSDVPGQLPDAPPPEAAASDSPPPEAAPQETPAAEAAPVREAPLVLEAAPVQEAAPVVDAPAVQQAVPSEPQAAPPAGPGSGDSPPTENPAA